MKKIWSNYRLVAMFCFALFSINALPSMGQKFSYVDSDYILEQLPEFRSAQKQLDDAAEGFRKELQKKKEELEKIKTAYDAEYMLLPDEQKKKKEAEILLKSKDYESYKKDKFGADGDLIKKRIELVKPIQDKVFEAVQKVAKENNQDFILDKAGAVTILFSNPKYDRSDEVLELLGVGANAKPDKSKTGVNDPSKGINKLLKDEEKTKNGILPNGLGTGSQPSNNPSGGNNPQPQTPPPGQPQMPNGGMPPTPQGPR